MEIDHFLNSANDVLKALEHKDFSHVLMFPANTLPARIDVSYGGGQDTETLRRIANAAAKVKSLVNFQRTPGEFYDVHTAMLINGLIVNLRTMIDHPIFREIAAKLPGEHRVPADGVLLIIEPEVLLAVLAAEEPAV